MQRGVEGEFVLFLRYLRDVVHVGEQLVAQLLQVGNEVVFDVLLRVAEASFEFFTHAQALFHAEGVCAVLLLVKAHNLGPSEKIVFGVSNVNITLGAYKRRRTIGGNLIRGGIDGLVYITKQAIVSRLIAYLVFIKGFITIFISIYSCTQIY